MSDYNACLPSPTIFGLPDAFAEWRPHQDQAAMAVYGSELAAVAAVAPTGFGKSPLAVAVAAMIKAAKPDARTAYLTETKGLQKQLCVAPETRILTADLRHMRADSLRHGDFVMGFDEERSPNRRMWRLAMVTDAARIRRPSYRLVLEDGTVLVCSAEHKWLVFETGGMAKWMTTEQLRVATKYGRRGNSKYATKLLRATTVWDHIGDYDTGYLAGAFDGEGCFTQRSPGFGRGAGVAVTVSMSQCDNEMLAEVQAALSRKGFNFSVSWSRKNKPHPKHRPCALVHVRHRSEVMRFLGEIRPHRLLPKFDPTSMGMLNPLRRVALVEKEFIGETELVALQTTSRTYIAEGIASHNCDDFASMGLVDVRGQSNYECLLVREEEGRSERCDSGPCHAGVDCTLKAAGCLYYDAYRRAKWSDLVLTNYDYWLNVHRSAGENPDAGLGDFDLLVLDEAHGAPDKVCDFLATEISSEAVEGVLAARMPPRDADLAGWGDWAHTHRKLAQHRHDYLAAQAKQSRLGADERRELKILRGLVTQLATVETAADGDASNWIVDRGHGNDARFDPVWPAPYLQQLLQGTTKTLLLSATIRRKTMQLLGFDAGQYEFLEYPSGFPVERRPVIWVPTVVMRYPFTEDKNREMLRRVDQIIARRRDRKGVIHTVSYERARYIYEHSANRDLMLLNEAKTTQTVVQRFKDSVEPRVLVSPSVSTGYDFPGEECEYQILVKVPFSPTTSPVMKARVDRDAEYQNYMTMQQVVQMVGRGMRSVDDQCESFIVDDSWNWFRGKARQHAPKWFMDACRESSYVPAPLPKLEAQG